MAVFRLRCSSYLLRGHSFLDTAGERVCVRQKDWFSSESGAEVDVKPLKTTKLSSFKRGTGGRSSFNGVVATVFGASGFLGRYVVNQLGKQGTQVIIAYRGDSYDVGRLKLCGDLGQILFVPHVVNDDDNVRKAVKHSNVVINLIGKDHDTRNFSLEDTHVTVARHLARIAKECGVDKFIHMSALNCTEHPKPVIFKGGSGFLSSKWHGEQAVREEFPEAIIFRPSNIFGQEDRFLRYFSGLWRRHFRRMPMWNMGVGVVKQPVYVSDVAKGIVNAIFDASAVGKTYQAVGPTRYELCELVDWMYRVMRKDAENWGYKRTSMKYDIPFWLRLAIFEMLPVYRAISRESIEREQISDFVSDDLPTLEDLGVVLTTLQERIKWELKYYSATAYYDEELGEFEEPAPAKIYVG